MLSQVLAHFLILSQVFEHFLILSQLLAHFLIFPQVFAHFLIPTLVLSTLDKIAKNRCGWSAVIAKTDIGGMLLS